MPRPPSVKQKCMWHTMRRMRERYGIEVNKREYESMIDQALQDEDAVVQRDDGTTIHRVKVRDVEVYALLDATGTIVKTVYPLDAELFNRPWMLNE